MLLLAATRRSLASLITSSTAISGVLFGALLITAKKGSWDKAGGRKKAMKQIEGSCYAVSISSPWPNPQHLLGVESDLPCSVPNAQPATAERSKDATSVPKYFFCSTASLASNATQNPGIAPQDSQGEDDHQEPRGSELSTCYPTAQPAWRTDSASHSPRSQ